MDERGLHYFRVSCIYDTKFYKKTLFNVELNDSIAFAFKNGKTRKGN